MQAVVQHRYGGSEQLSLAEVADPAAGPGEVLVEVRAAGVDRGTWHLMTGLPLVMRLGFGFRGPKVPVPGRDVSGVVVAVGPDVTSYAAGEEVIGTADGSFAELAVVPVKRLARKPSSVTHEEAAVLPVSGLTALQAIRKAGVSAGQQVLVIGASGGVGSYAVQLAVAAGATVTGVAGGAKADLVRDLGAERVLDHTRQEIEQDGRYDVIIDIAGRRPLPLLRRALAPEGTLVVVGGEGGDRWLGGFQRQLALPLRSVFTRQRLLGLLSKESSADLAELARLVDAGDVRPTLDRTFTLDEAAKAVDHVADGHARGKVAVVPTTQES
ncbi:NAD(P)-dependent alcohol dehydrogenase [Nocardioides aestuarii]|uniref:NAD(P)-dependent alcohol dehydrogenase n=1 Tax=Nocardioides aestuarii TaxID=252231 RepID=A0ABW4TK02_9ACTN